MVVSAKSDAAYKILGCRHRNIARSIAPHKTACVLAAAALLVRFVSDHNAAMIASAMPQPVAVRP